MSIGFLSMKNFRAAVNAIIIVLPYPVEIWAICPFNDLFSIKSKIAINCVIRSLLLVEIYKALCKIEIN